MDGFLDRGAVRFHPVGIDDLSTGQRRLGHELHSLSVVSLRGMDDKRMTQPHIAGFAGGNGFRQMVGAVGESTSRVDKSPRLPSLNSCRAASKWLPSRSRVGASSGPTSLNRNSNRSRRSREVGSTIGLPTASVPVASMCQPTSPGSSGIGKRIGKSPVPRAAPSGLPRRADRMPLAAARCWPPRQTVGPRGRPGG